MNADWNDAPGYIRTNTRRNSAKNWIIPSVIGTCITLGLLQVAGTAYLKGTVQNLADKDMHSTSVPVAEITRPEKLTNKDWDRAVDEQVRRDLRTQSSAPPSQAEIATSPAKQNVFNVNNYIPRGADNIVAFKKPDTPIEKPVAKMKVTIIEQTPSMKDRACWPHREGSIERRNCRSSIGLNYRD